MFLDNVGDKDNKDIQMSVIGLQNWEHQDMTLLK